MQIIPVILSGGSGTRLWPASRKSYPKQFQNLLDDKHTLLQQTCLRLQDLGSVALPLIVVGNEDCRFFISGQLQHIGLDKTSIILEPQAKNTAPAILLATLFALEQAKDALVLVLPADHFIENSASFCQEILKAAKLLETKNAKNCLLTFGIKPTSAHTGYGYIEMGDKIENGNFVQKFTEKPNEATAKQFIANKKHLWNSGMFLFKASDYVAETKKHAPDIFQHVSTAWQKRSIDNNFIRPDKSSWQQSPSDSIDYAIMENTKNAVVMPININWNDVGTWQELYKVSKKDDDGNSINQLHANKFYAIDSKNCYVKSNQKRIISLLGQKDLIVVDTEDALLIADIKQSESVKQLVAKMQQGDAKEHDCHAVIYRPWGKFKSIEEGKSFKVKLITVNAGASLSLQTHQHRSEHWVVVKGTATITNGDAVFSLVKNQSTYIPVGVKHRLTNNTDSDLEIIEVQVGDYLEEDDIVRYDDNFGRAD